MLTLSADGNMGARHLLRGGIAKEAVLGKLGRMVGSIDLATKKSDSRPGTGVYPKHTGNAPVTYLLVETAPIWLHAPNRNQEAHRIFLPPRKQSVN